MPKPSADPPRPRARSAGPFGRPPSAVAGGDSAPAVAVLWGRSDGCVPHQGHTCLSEQMSLLNCLCAAIPARERVITCEEVFELRVPLPDVVSMQTRQPNLEGAGEIPLRRL